LEEGIAKTIEYYAKHRDHYWTKPEKTSPADKETVTATKR
jgi:hypothetical protein